MTAPKVVAVITSFLLVLASFLHTCYGSKSNSLAGKNLRVVAGHFPPVIYISMNSSGHVVEHSGLLSNQLLYLSAKLNFTFDIFASRENTNGVKQKNGTWNGVIGHILRGEADLGLVPVAINLERYQAIEFSGSLGGDDSGILVKYPEPSVSFTGAFDIWIGWITSGLVIVVISISLAYVTKRQSFGVGEHDAIRAGTFAWYLFGTMVSQGDYCRFRRSSQKLLAATWCLIAFVFVNVYNSTLTSYMSVTYQRPIINSMSDLAANPSYKMACVAGAIQYIDLTPTSTCISFLQKYNSERVKCRLAMAYQKQVQSWKPMFLAVPKSSPYTEEINRESLWFIDIGMRVYWYGKHDKLPDQCRLDYNSKGVASKRSSNRIKLEQFYLPFLVLFCGYLLAFVQFCRENLMRVIRRQ
ncbi:hypothetical protein DAPPUDRAFT_113577 [Daphnia pulex]|uniref:Ionotropic glutamate receptor C-terminal domain-containing protein n=1 Tax=Daphnia pulex TaxID=6669 RepID=E9HFE1_DAPPU|nr:hypothetical protein DAPPUDRAFT_113577 [Daphnia pulex]|eukprot:EFX69516.1 hypothetical protein DAPPUDRAFT_113577 [Daphnia pulex]